MAVIFDFDLTLAPATVPWLLRQLGVDDTERWERERRDPMVRDGWDKILAEGPALIRTADEHGIALTRELAERAGAALPCFEGVEQTMDSLRVLGREASGGADVELYVLSSGFVEVMGASRVAKCFDALWGSALHWDEAGRLVGVKRAVIASEKARYLLALAKGLDIAGADEPQYVHRDKPIAEWHLPLDQMIYVGDGGSDIAAFKLMHESGGLAIGVDHSGRDRSWSASEHLYKESRVDNIAAPDFREGSELRCSLSLAVECVAKRIALRSRAQRS